MANNKQKKTTLWVRVMCVFLACACPWSRR